MCVQSDFRIEDEAKYTCALSNNVNNQKYE